MDKFAKTIATFFGIGYFPVAPGTVATAAGAGLAFMLSGHGWAYVAVTAAVLAAGIPLCGHVEKTLGQKDPGIVVLDEVVGILIAMAGLPMTWAVVISVFFLFRAFDMFKIYPVNKCEALPGGWGIMLDDVMAGVYANLVMHIAVRWAGI